MYLPPAGTIPENQEDPDVPLKKILLWNGASSWGGLKPGRGIFLKEKCPVSTCVLSSARGEAESADLVLFKDHFTMPYFKRPTNQIWMLYLLGILDYFERKSLMFMIKNVPSTRKYSSRQTSSTGLPLTARTLQWWLPMNAGNITMKMCKV